MRGNTALQRAQRSRGFPTAMGNPFTAKTGLRAVASPVSNPVSQFSQDPNSIVQVIVATQVAPYPNTYQQMGALVSFGGTTMAPNNAALLTQLNDLNLFHLAAIEVDGAEWTSANLATYTVTTPLPAEWSPGDTVLLSTVGFAPDAYNIPRGMATIVDANSFTMASAGLTDDPGVATTLGTASYDPSVQLGQMATTYFSQGNFTGVYVLELGYQQDIAGCVSALQQWLLSNPRVFCHYMVSRDFGLTEAALAALEPILKQYQNPEAMTYFYLTIDPSLIATLGPTYKDVVLMCEDPSVSQFPNNVNPNGEFSLAAQLYNAVAFVPTDVTPVGPMKYKYVYGVTPYNTINNGPLLKSFHDNFVNYVATGAEGGVSFTMLNPGCTADGRDYFNYWFTIDWIQINVQLNLANAIINGSNNPSAPLRLNQNGIDRLLGVLAGTMRQGVRFVMVNGSVIQTELNPQEQQLAIQLGKYTNMCDCNATPFTDYYVANPSHYRIGEYDGLSTIFVPMNGFSHIIVTVTATDFITQ